MVRARPTSVTVAASLNLVFGSLILVGCAGFQGAEIALDGQQPLWSKMRTTVPLFMFIKVGGFVLHLLLGIALIVSAIGLRLMRRWGWVSAILTSSLAIPLELGILGYEFAVINPALRQDRKFVRGLDDAVSLIRAIPIVIYLVVLLTMMLRPTVRAAFSGRMPPFPGAEEWYHEREDHSPRPDDWKA
jgi:hypothetical protein